MFKPVDQTAQKNFWGKTKKRRQPDHPVVTAFADPKVDFIRACIEKDRGGDEIKQILDVGCGNGFFTRPLANRINEFVRHLFFSEHSYGKV